MQKQEKHVPCVNKQAWMQIGEPRDKASLEGKLIEVIADYKKYIKEQEEEQDMLLKALRDMEAEHNSERAKLLRKIADIQDGWDTQLQVAQCQLNEMQEKLKNAIQDRDVLHCALNEITTERDWLVSNQKDDVDTIDRLWKKNKKLKRKIKIIKELMKC